MRWIPQLPGSGEAASSTTRIQIDKLSNVEFIPNTELDANGVKDYGAEIVVVATGGYWATNGSNGCTHDTIDGADASQPWCLTPEQIMHEGKEVARAGVVKSTTTATSWAPRSPRSSRRRPPGHTHDAPRPHRALHALHARGAEHAP